MQIEITFGVVSALLTLAGTIMFATFKIGSVVGSVLTELRGIRKDVDLLIRHVFPSGRPLRTEDEPELELT